MVLSTRTKLPPGFIQSQIPLVSGLRAAGCSLRALLPSHQRQTTVYSLQWTHLDNSAWQLHSHIADAFGQNDLHSYSDGDCCHERCQPAISYQHIVPQDTLNQQPSDKKLPALALSHSPPETNKPAACRLTAAEWRARAATYQRGCQKLTSSGSPAKTKMQQ